MERHDLLPDTPLSLFLSLVFFLPPQHTLFPFTTLSFPLSFLLSLIHSQSAKSQLVVPAEQLQGRETQMEMFVENNMCIIKV